MLSSPDFKLLFPPASKPNRQVPDEDADLDPDQVEMLEAEIEADYDIGDTIRRSLVGVTVERGGWAGGRGCGAPGVEAD
jgi:hypothetical protein